MSQENVELTRRAFEASKDRDLDGLLAMMADDVEAFPILAGLEGGYRGHDGIRRWWTGLLGTFPDFSRVDASTWQVSQFRHGQCIGWHVYTSEREALEAVRLAG